MKIIKRKLFWILCLAVLVRLLVLYLTKGHWYNTDSYNYIKQADSILSAQPFGYFPNGYPLIVALSKIIAGDSLFIYFLLFLNVMLSAMSVALGYLVGKELFGDRTAIVIAFVLLLYPNQLNYVREIMSEVPAEFFLMLGLYALLKDRYFISSILLIITCYIRTEFIPIFFILGLIILLKDRRLGNLYKFAAGVMLMAAIIVFVRYDGIVKPPNNMGENLLYAINRNSHEGLDFTTSRYTQEQVAHPITTYLNFAEQHSSQYLSQRFWSLWELWGPWPGDGNNPRARRGVLAKCVIGSRFIFLLLALFAAYSYRNRWQTYILLTPVFIITAVHFVFYSTPRYEYVVEPLVIILAMGEVKIICNKIHKYWKCHPDFPRLTRGKEDLVEIDTARCR